MTEVFVGIGSNIDPLQNTQHALVELSSRFGEIQVSRIFESKPVGFEGENFLNLVVRFSTEISVRGLVEAFREIEEGTGRVRNANNVQDKEFASRTLDIDILLYGDHLGSFDGVELPRKEITEYAHVLLPLTDVAGGRVHPGIEKTYDELWQLFKAGDQKLWPVEAGFEYGAPLVRHGRA